MKLENRRILITGGGSGVGLELARQLADANDVVIAGRTTTNSTPPGRQFHRFESPRSM